jgi:hypothetical protein
MINQIEQKYNQIGKVSYSNNENNIGKILMVSEPNYIHIVDSMKLILNIPFEECKHNFLVHLIENSTTNGVLRFKNYTLVLLFDMTITFKFALFYDSKFRNDSPAILKADYSMFNKETIEMFLKQGIEEINKNFGK